MIHRLVWIGNPPLGYIACDCGWHSGYIACDCGWHSGYVGVGEGLDAYAEHLSSPLRISPPPPGPRGPDPGRRPG